MLKSCSCTTAEIIAIVLSLSLTSIADAEQYNNGGASSCKQTSSTCSIVRSNAATVHQAGPTPPDRRADHHGYAQPGFGRPRQDPRDAWDGYFENPFDNPNYHGSNGG